MIFRLHPITLPASVAFGACLLALSASLHAAHPLITDDTSTQGAGHWQWELNTEHTNSTAPGFSQYSAQVGNTLTYGAGEKLDVLVSTPWIRLGQDASTVTPGVSGFMDGAIDLKWKFYEQGPLSLAAKTGVILQNGSASRGLGTGKTNWSAYLVTAYETKPWMFLLHAGYLRNNNTAGERVDLWHLSAAVVRQLGEKWRVALDGGADSNPDPASNTNPTFVVAGLIWSPHADVDLDIGFKRTNDGVQTSDGVLAGLAVRW